MSLENKWSTFIPRTANSELDWLTPQRLMLDIVTKKLRRKPIKQTPTSVMFETDSHVVTHLVISMGSGMYQGNYVFMDVTAITASGKKEDVFRTKLDGKIHYNLGNTNSWWLDEMNPDFKDINAVKRAIDKMTKETTDFLAGYLKKIEAPVQSAGPDLQRALKLNRMLKLNIDENALAQLFEALA